MKISVRNISGTAASNKPFESIQLGSMMKLAPSREFAFDVESLGLVSYGLLEGLKADVAVVSVDGTVLSTEDAVTFIKSGGKKLLKVKKEPEPIVEPKVEEKTVEAPKEEEKKPSIVDKIVKAVKKDKPKKAAKDKKSKKAVEETPKKKKKTRKKKDK